MKKLIALLAAGVLCVTSALAVTFPDVTSGDWYYEAVTEIAQEGIITGATDGNFYPNAYVTRATVVTVMWRMMGSPTIPGAPPFLDIAASDWYAEAANWAYKVGIASGYASGDFGGNDRVTREQLAVFLHRFTQYKGMEIAHGTLTAYGDAAKVSNWATDGMRHAVGAGLMAGDTHSNLNPGGLAVRAELATMLVRFMTPAAG